MNKKIIRFANKIRKRLILIELLDVITLGTIIAIGIGLILIMISFLVPIYKAFEMALFAIATTIIVSAIYATTRFPTTKKSALIADSKGLKERLTTSLELLSVDDCISNLQKEDTIEAIKKYDIKKNIPIKIKTKRIIKIVLMAIILISTNYIPYKMKEKAIERHNVAQQKKEEVKKLEKIKKEVKKDLNKLEKEDQKEIEKLIENSIKEIKQVLNKKDIEKELKRLDKKLEKIAMDKKTLEQKNIDELRKKINENSETLKKSLAQKDKNQLLDSLKKDDKLKELAKALEQMDKEALNKELSKLAKSMGEISKTDADKIMSNINNLAQSLNNQQLSESMQQLAKEMQNGNISQSTLDQVSNSMQALSDEAGATPSLASESSISGGQQGLENGSGEAKGSGSGSGNGSGNGNGGGSNSGNGTGTGWNYGSKQGIQKEDNEKELGENVFIPEREIGNDKNLTGNKSNASGNSTQMTDENLTTRGTSVQYDSVVGEYTEEVMENINDKSIPESMKGVVKEYFNELNN